MRVLFLGASGRTGQHALTTYLSHPNTTASALVRDPSRLPTPSPRLTLTPGTPLSQSDIAAALAAAPANDPVVAVIITLGVPRTSESFFGKPTAEPGFLRSCVVAATGAMRAAGVKRLVVLSAFGTGASYAQMAAPLKAVFRFTRMAVVWEEHQAVEEALRGGGAEGIEWTLVKPPMLKDGEEKAVEEFGERGLGIGMMDSATRGSVGATLVKAVLEDKWKNGVVVIANRG